MTEPALVERITLHCFKCRAQQEHKRILASAPVFRCLGGCGNTREVEELGRVAIVGRIIPVAPRAWPSTEKFKPRKYTNRRKESTVKKSPLIMAIEKIVDEKFGQFRGLDREQVIEIINGQLGIADAPTKSTCPRAPHKGRHGKACVEAGYSA